MGLAKFARVIRANLNLPTLTADQVRDTFVTLPEPAAPPV
jgi:hypothetical protein